MTNAQLFQQFIDIHLTGRGVDDIMHAAKEYHETFKRRDSDMLRAQTANESKLRQIQEMNEIQAGGS